MEPSERFMATSLAANTRWAKEPDRTAATSPARAAFNARFDDEVDPGRVLAPAERARRAESARKAYFMRLALKSAQSRRKAAEARKTSVDLARQADNAESELAAGGTA